MRVDGCAALPRTRECRVQPVIVDFLASIDDDVVALADAHEQRAADLGRHGHEVVGDDGEVVPDEGDGEAVVHTGIDQAQAVHLPRCQGEPIIGSAATLRVDVLATQLDVIAWWRSSACYELRLPS